MRSFSARSSLFQRILNEGAPLSETALGTLRNSALWCVYTNGCSIQTRKQTNKQNMNQNVRSRVWGMSRKMFPSFEKGKKKQKTVTSTQFPHIPRNSNMCRVFSSFIQQNTR
mmetsp:Transcript_19395/g.22254  ORF Transcript_19395/g.22254 Transcript_19395/m.22254 type:complete len:112 (+) Transcript_19395:326-661(+)